MLPYILHIILFAFLCSPIAVTSIPHNFHLSRRQNPTHLSKITPKWSFTPVSLHLPSHASASKPNKATKVFDPERNVASSDNRRGPTRIGNKVVLDPWGSTKYPAWKPTGVKMSCNPKKWVRKEFREYSEADREKYVLALKCLRSKPSRLRKAIKSPSAYDDFVYSHWKALMQAHNTAAFLPWHRVFIRALEEALKTCGWKKPLPYWDWSHDSQAPEKSLIWKRQYFGGNGDPKKNGCIKNGNFSVQATFPYRHCVQRDWQTGSKSDPNFGDMLGAQFSPVEMDYVTAVDTYDQFRRGLENHPHNSIHAAIGGDMWDPTLSVNDPVFFLHHANVDRWWWKWQKEHPKAAFQYSGNNRPGWNNFDAKSTDILVFYGLWADTAVKEVLNPAGNGAKGAMCFSYSNSIGPPNSKITDPRLRQPVWGGRKKRSIADAIARRQTIDATSAHGSPYNPRTPDPYDRTDYYNIRRHEPLPDAFVMRMHHNASDIKDIREQEKQLFKFIDYINGVPDYVSTCALVYKEIEGYDNVTSVSEEEDGYNFVVRYTLVTAAKEVVGSFRLKPGTQTLANLLPVNTTTS
ncbi:hypothetical protein HDV00_010253 [Rhizophlyctis rosea]|nr:hypothetical protein HDV00_010253 [Rhizophlyctis rosea]